MKAGGMVLDCMVFIQVIASRGPAHRCFQMALNSDRPIYLSPCTLAELRTVLNRSDLRAKLPGLTEHRIEALLHHLSEFATFVEPVPAIFRFPPDPKDEPYLNLAIQVRAGHLVTRDKALLRLADPRHELHSALKSLHKDLLIAPPESLLTSEEK